MYGQNWSPSPQYPNWLQHRPKVDPRQFTLLPHLPSVLDRWPAGSVTAGEDDVVLEVVTRVDVGVVLVLGGLLEVVGGLVVGPPGVVVPLLDGFPGRPGTPRHAPKLLWQPAPQNSSVEPHQKNWEQQGPKLGLPMHMVWLPHMPLVVTERSPVGTGVVDVDVAGGLTEVELGVDVGGR